MQDYDDDDDDDSEGDEDLGPPQNKLRSNKKRKGSKPAKKRKGNSDSESSDEDFDGFTMSNMGKYFQRTYDTLSDYVPAFPSFFGSDDDDDDEEYDDDASKIRKPKVKNSLELYSKSRLPNQVMAQEKTSRWYDKFFFGSDDTEAATTTPTPLPKVKVTTEPGFFSWFGGSEEVTTEKPIAETEQGSMLALKR